MRNLWLLLLIFAGTAALGQSPQDLLQLAQLTYKSVEGYEIKGPFEVQLPGSSTALEGEVTVAALPEPLRAGKFHGPSVRPLIKPRPGLSITLPVEVFGQFSTIAERVASVTEVGSEQLPLNGTPVPCRILKVTYQPHAYVEGHDAPVTYSICSDRHLVLRKSLAASASRQGTGPLAQWTLTFTTARFGAAPDWLLASQPTPALSTRAEWIGKPAPDFTLPVLDGAKARLSAMRGKVVLLDFWGVNCAPCVHSLPSLQATADAYQKRDVSVWSVSIDQPEILKKWLLTHTDTLPILNDAGFAVSDLYQVHGIPAIVLVGRDGKIRNYWKGEVPQQELEAALEQALQS